jgi:TPR repeat protein
LAQKFYADNGDAQAHAFLGDLYFFGLRGVPQNYDIARAHYENAAAQGEFRWTI